MWPFSKKSNNAEELKKSVELSFSNVKKDYEDHHMKINLILERLEKLERNHVNMSRAFGDELKSPNETLSIFDSLTDKQKAFLQVLAALNSESPNKWILLRTFAQELYPNKQYNEVRSFISQYLAHLEELGFAKRKKSGKFAYIMTTSLNPYVREIASLKEKPKKQDKKSKQS